MTRPQESDGSGMMIDTKELLQDKISKKIDELDDLLESALPKTDKKHREEIFDILSLVRYRAEQYLREYGVNENAIDDEED